MRFLQYKEGLLDDVIYLIWQAALESCAKHRLNSRWDELKATIMPILGHTLKD
jgi:hypothetical protein